jgi:hypothetical protein
MKNSATALIAIASAPTAAAKTAVAGGTAASDFLRVMAGEAAKKAAPAARATPVPVKAEKLPEPGGASGAASSGHAPVAGVSSAASKKKTEPDLEQTPSARKEETAAGSVAAGGVGLEAIVPARKPAGVLLGTTKHIVGINAGTAANTLSSDAFKRPDAGHAVAGTNGEIAASTARRTIPIASGDGAVVANEKSPPNGGLTAAVALAKGARATPTTAIPARDASAAAAMTAHSDDGSGAAKNRGQAIPVGTTSLARKLPDAPAGTAGEATAVRTPVADAVALRRVDTALPGLSRPAPRSAEPTGVAAARKSAPTMGTETAPAASARTDGVGRAKDGTGQPGTNGPVARVAKAPSTSPLALEARTTVAIELRLPLGAGAALGAGVPANATTPSLPAEAALASTDKAEPAAAKAKPARANAGEGKS